MGLLLHISMVPGGTQVPRVVADAMVQYLFHHNANTHWPTQPVTKLISSFMKPDVHWPTS